MPSVEVNHERWQTYDWEKAGDEWSEIWGGTRNLWGAMLEPRMRPLLKNANTILEIAPGFGRITAFLKDYCEEMHVVDLAERCIEQCQERFRDETHIQYHVNDGKSLDMIEEGSIDLAVSFDSLVHCEGDVLDAYIGGLHRALKPNGLAFLHHSNIAAFKDRETGYLSIPNRHWRASTVSAEIVREEYCPKHDMVAISQEIIPWGDYKLIDCFTVFTKKGSIYDRPCQLEYSPEFMIHAESVARSTKFYSIEPNEE